jgi:hypothetical protein
MRRVFRLSLVGVGLSIAAAGLWLVWAKTIGYPGLDGRTGCPLGTASGGHPWLVAAALSAVTAAGMGWWLWRRNFRPEAVVLGLLNGAVAFGAILLVALPFFGGLRCFD